MKKVFLALFGISIFISCNNSSGSDPKIVLSQFMDALMKKDVATARKLSTADSKSMMDLMEMGMKSDKNESEKYDKSRMVFGDAKIDGDKAIIPVKETTTGETINYTMKKENGQWKVAFDKASLMSMGMEKMSEKGINASDSLSKGMEELKNMNMDSLKEGMQEGMKMLDSMTKEMKKLQDK